VKLLIIRGDLQSHSGYSAAMRDYSLQLRELFDRLIGVDIHYSSDRPYERCPFPLVSEPEARHLSEHADFALVLSMTTPDCYACYPNCVNVGLTFWETDRLPLQGAERSPWVAQANRMDALWAPSTHIKEAFQAAGVVTPIRVIPWPIRVPPPQKEGLPNGEVYDLDRSPWLSGSLLALARFREPRFRWSRWLTQHGAPRAAARLLARLRTPAHRIPLPHERALLCVAQDVPRKGLLLLLSEWMEFKRQSEAKPWVLIVKTTPINPQTPKFDFVIRFWEHVQALKRQLWVDQADVFLWTGNLAAADFDRLLNNTFGQVAPSLGEGFCGPAAAALALGKPLVAPRHTAFADYIPPDYPYAFLTRPVRVSFVGDPLRVYDPASTWNVPVPYSLAGAITRLAIDLPERRAEACRRARIHMHNWCGPDRVHALLEEEVKRLAALPARLAA
jgi:glycosyltransferase involved in cell wall biosynthesis